MKNKELLTTSFILISICLSFVFSNSVFSIEREQEGIVAFDSIEKQIILHFMQGKGFFKNGNYRSARMEFEEVLNLNPNHESSYIYLTRIEDVIKEGQKQQYEKERHISAVMDNVERKERLVDDEEDYSYELTAEEKDRIDQYMSEVTFKDMLETQRVKVVAKSEQIRKEIDSVLSVSRDRSIKKNVEYEKTPFLIKGFEDRKALPVKTKDKARYIEDEQKDQDMEIMFDLKKKLKDYYARGLMYYKQKDYFEAKKYFTAIIRLEPSYRYAQEYYDSCKSKVVLNEIRQRRRDSSIHKGFKKGRIAVQEPVEFIAEKRASEKSKKLSESLRKEFITRQTKERRINRKNVLKEAIGLYNAKDYTKALEKLELVLLQFPKDNLAKKYKNFCEKALIAREEEMLGAFDMLNSTIESSRIEPSATKEHLIKRAQEVKTKEVLRLKDVVDVDSKIRRLRKLGKKHFAGKDYSQAKVAFKEILKFDPSNEYAKKYISKIDKAILKKNALLEKKEQEKLYLKGYKLYKERSYKDAATEFWILLKRNPSHKKAQKYLKLCSNRLKIDMAVILKREDNLSSLSKKEIIKSGIKKAVSSKQILLKQ